MRIIPPEDVPSSSVPMYNNENMAWSGREVTQLRRSITDQLYYIGESQAFRQKFFPEFNLFKLN